MIDIVLNGEAQTVAEGQSLLQLLESLKLDPQRVAIELNRSIVRQQEWNTTVVPAGARLEIVQFVGGG